MPMSSPTRPFVGPVAMFCAVAMLVVGLPAIASADNHPIKIHRLGNPNSAISKTAAHTVEDVQRLATEYENALKVALAQSTFDGDPQDLLDAIARGDGEMVSIAPGTTHQWMMFRKGGQPAISSRPVEWAGRKPLDAYRTTVASGRYVYTFDIPLTCINLALYDRQEAPPPACSLQASASTPEGYDVLGDISVRASGDGAVKISGIEGPSGTIDAGRARANGANAWTFAPTESGRHAFTAMVSDDYGRTATCTADALVAPAKPRPKPECQLSAGFTPDPDTIGLDASGSKGTVTITGFTLPDGTAGDLGALRSEGTNRWSYAPTLPKKSGEYTYTFQAESALEGQTDPCADAQALVPVVREHAWILRGYGASINGDDDVNTDDGTDRAFLTLGKGAGFGLGLEYLFSDRWGVEGGILFGELDAEAFVDRGDLWAHAEDEVSFRPLMLGLNYHMTPGRKADFYIGPFVALVQYSSARFNLPFTQINTDYDDDFGVGLNLGVDIPFGSSAWGFNGGVRYLQTTADEDGGLGRSLDIDPLILSAGVGVRF